MRYHIINIHLSELLSSKTKEFKINELSKKKKCFTIIINKINMNNLHFIPNNILTKFLKS